MNEHEALVERAVRAKRTVLLVGGLDTGKTTLSRMLLRAAVEAGRLSAFIDADVGQKSVGPPATVTLKMVRTVADLEPAVGGPGTGDGVPDRSSGRGPGSGRAEAGSGIGALQLSRARTVASSLDLRGARVDEALDALSRYLDDASLAGLEQVTIIHGLGTGALRDAVRAQAGSHPLVRSFRAGERGEGGDGATIVRL